MIEPSANGHRSNAPIAVVLPGGGARGAYEIGALSALLPALQKRGERATIWCGTSVGAINAAMLGSLADLPVAEQVSLARAQWMEMRKRDVVAPLAGRGGARMALRMVGHALGLPGIGLASLFDPSPLAGSLDRWIEWDRLADNVDTGAAGAVCVIATALATGGPVAFVATAGAVPNHPDDDFRYVPTRITGEHVRASAAIPMLFPTVEVSTPRRARGHYIDGGTRLNSPIKPALNLGATRVIVIGLEPFAPGAGRSATVAAPGIADVAANMLDGLLVDQVAYDLRRLAAINSFFVEDASTGVRSSPRAYRLARGHAPYRPVDYALVSPRRRGTIGRLAVEVFERRYGGLRGLRDLDYVVMSRALGGRARSRGELLSFLLFDPEFVEALLKMGRNDANRWLRRHPGFWCREAAHDLSIGPLDRHKVAEIEAIDEFRAMRRH